MCCLYDEIKLYIILKRSILIDSINSSEFNVTNCKHRNSNASIEYNIRIIIGGQNTVHGVFSDGCLYNMYNAQPGHAEV